VERPATSDRTLIHPVKAYGTWDEFVQYRENREWGSFCENKALNRVVLCGTILGNFSCGLGRCLGECGKRDQASQSRGGVWFAFPFIGSLTFLSLPLLLLQS